MKAIRIIAKTPPGPYWETRRRYIGGSDIARLVAGDLWAVWNSKRLGETGPDTEAMAWGRRLEDYVADEWARQHPEYRVRRVHALLGHPRITWMAASLDRLCYGPPDGPYPLEIKTTGAAAWDDVPAPYRAQALWQCLVTDAPRALVAVLFRGQRLATYTVERDPDLESALVNLGGAFWARLQLDDPPPLDDSAAAQRWVTRLYPAATQDLYRPVPADAAEAWATFWETTATLRAAQRARDAAATRLKAAIGDARGLTDGRRRITWVRRTVTRTDWARLLREHAEVQALVPAYTTTRTEDGGLRATDEGGDTP